VELCLSPCVRKRHEGEEQGFEKIVEDVERGDWRKIGPTCWEAPYYTNIYFIKYYFSYTMKKDEMDNACSTYGTEEIIVQSRGRKPQRKIPLERNGHRWENNNTA
jgi:hypothetical protein